MYLIVADHEVIRVIYIRAACVLLASDGESRAEEEVSSLLKRKTKLRIKFNPTTITRTSILYKNNK